MTEKIKVAILISGRGSNMMALIKACEQKNFPAKIVLVLSNKIDAIGLKLAKEMGIKTAIIENKNFSRTNFPNLSLEELRKNFDQKINEEIEKSEAQLVCLAGFMRLLSEWFVERWFNRLINIHPSLLPNFKGSDAIGDAIKAKAKKSGCTVHLVRKEMDSGPIIMQAEVLVFEDDTKETLAERILCEEHRIYPESLKLVCQKIIKADNEYSSFSNLS
jgi:phosphoribosylglycinamide formyltransferase-1